MAVSLLSSVRSARASAARAVRRRAAAPWARLREAAAFFAVVERLVAPALREAEAVFVAVARVVVRRAVLLRAVVLRAVLLRAVVLRVVPVVAAMRAPLSKVISSNVVRSLPRTHVCKPPERIGYGRRAGRALRRGIPARRRGAAPGASCAPATRASRPRARPSSAASRGRRRPGAGPPRRPRRPP